MLRKILFQLAVAVLMAFVLSGCKKASDEPAKPPKPNQQVQQVPQPKTMDEYRAEAQKEINKENISQELEKLEKEINQDVSEQK